MCLKIPLNFNQKWHIEFESDTLSVKIPLNFKQKWHIQFESDTFCLKIPLNFKQKWHIELGSDTLCLNIPLNFNRKWHIKKRHPNPAFMGGGKTFSNKKGLVGRMTMIQSALDSSDLGEYFIYPQRHEKVYRKCFRDVWSQKLRQKVAKSRNFEASFWTWKNGFLRFPCFCAFSLRLIHRMIMNQRALDTSGPGEHFKYQ